LENISREIIEKYSGHVLKVWHGPLERALFMLLFKARINFINYDKIGFDTFDL